MNKTVIFLMLLSCCLARSIDETEGVLDTPSAEPLLVDEAVSDTKSTDEIVEESLTQIKTQDLNSPVDDDDSTRLLFKTTTTVATTTAAAAARPFTQTIDLLLVLNSNTVSARKST